MSKLLLTCFEIRFVAPTGEKQTILQTASNSPTLNRDPSL